MMEPASSTTIASVIGTSLTGKKAAFGGAILAMATDKITLNHVLAGSILAVVAAAVSATLWGSEVKSIALTANSIAVEAKQMASENHDRSENLNEALHMHAIEAEKRLGKIEYTLDLIESQNTTILKLLQQHEHAASLRRGPE